MYKNDMKWLVIIFLVGVVIGLFDTCKSPEINKRNNQVDSLMSVIINVSKSKDSLIKLSAIKTDKIDSLKKVQTKIEVKYKYIKQSGLDVIPSIVCDTAKLITNYNNLALYADSVITSNHAVIDYQDTLIIDLIAINKASDSIIKDINLVRSVEAKQYEDNINKLKKEVKKGKLKSFIKGFATGIGATALVISSILIIK